MAAELVEELNRRVSSAYRLVGRCRGGAHGAYLIENGAGRAAILKWSPGLNRRAALSRAAAMAERLRARGVPLPRYEHIDHREDIGTWWVQERLPGEPAGRVSPAVLEQVLALNDRQEGLAVAGAPSVTEHARRLLYGGVADWRGLAERHPEAAPVVGDLLALARPFEGFTGRRDDVVHSDFKPEHVLVQGDRVTGIIDFDNAGAGDRALDLASFLHQLLSRGDPAGSGQAAHDAEHADTVSRLAERTVEVAGVAGLTVYLAAYVLTRLAGLARRAALTDADHRTLRAGVRAASMLRQLGAS